jgi:hypothetical protein
MAEEQKQTQTKTQTPEIVDMPEGKMEISLRVLSNELIGVKMSVDDMKMKWVVIGVGAIGVLLWAASAFAPELTTMFDTLGG